jgi:hypothetical protein
LRWVRRERDSILVQKSHHRHEGDTLVSIDKGVILGEPKCVGGRELGEGRLLIAPFVDWALERRAQHALAAQTRRTTKAA